MDTIRYLIKFFIKMAFTFFFAAVIWWLVSLIFPSLSYKSLAFKPSKGTTLGDDWLPSPKKYSGLFGRKATVVTETTNLYVPAPAFSGYNINTAAQDSKDGNTYANYTYLTYTATGTMLVNVDGTPVIQEASASSNQEIVSPSKNTTDPATVPRNLYVRNLSVYEGGHIYTGLSFVGEARSNMFRDGKFPIVMVDQVGHAIGIAAAVATTDWSVPGWVRFESKIPYTLPNQTPCTMVFEEALTQQEKTTRNPLRVPLMVRCN